MSLEDEWRALESRELAGTGLVVRRVRPDSAQDLFIGLEVDRGSRVLVLEASAAAIQAGYQPVNARGIRSYVADIGKGRQALRLELMLPEFKDVFTNLVEDVVARVAVESSELSAVRAYVDRLLKWRVLLSQERTQKLSVERQLGLFGELFVLRGTAIRHFGVSAGVEAWRGPLGSDQDFHFRDGDLEVKTYSLGAESPAIKVASEAQLDQLPGRSLLLFALAAEFGAAEDGESLLDIVTAIRTLVHDHQPADALFEQRLNAGGYFDVHSDEYQTPIAIHEQRAFAVANGFPRLTQANLPQGVHRVSYEISIAACGTFELSLPDVLRILGDTPPSETYE